MLTYGERLRIGWFLLWRLYVPVVSIMTFIGPSLPPLWGDPIVNFAISLLVAYPLILPMMMRKQFRWHRVQIVRPESVVAYRGKQVLSYGERLRIGWFLLWRERLIKALGAGILTIVVRSFLALSPETAEEIGYFSSFPLALLVAYPLILPMMMRKQFKGFRLHIVRPEDEAAAELTQLPGEMASQSINDSASREVKRRRPIWIWLASGYYAFAGIFVLFAWYLILTGALPQTDYVWSYPVSAGVALAAATSLFLLRKAAFFLLTLHFVMSFSGMLYSLPMHWSRWSPFGLTALTLLFVVQLLIVRYSWTLKRQGILK